MCQSEHHDEQFEDDSRGLAASIRTSSGLAQDGLSTLALEVTGEAVHHGDIAIEGKVEKKVSDQAG